MHLILAQLKKDARALRGLLIAFGLCVVSYVASGLAHGQNLQNFAIVGFAQVWLGLALAVGGFAQWLGLTLVVEVIHADPLTEATAFWRTRPLPRGSFLAAKLLSILALAVALLLGGWAKAVLAGTPYDPTMTFWIIAMLLAAVAAITANMRQLLMRLLALGIAACLLSALVIPAIMSGFAHGDYDAKFDWNMKTWHELTAGFFSLGCLGVVVHQYLTLRARTSLVLLATVCFLTILGFCATNMQFSVFHTTTH